jgi:uncharacterized membrane protein YidH (DUF202 family)
MTSGTTGDGTGGGSPVDEGLQPERTELAWRRTVLSVAAVSLASARLLPELYGSALWVFPGLLGTALAGALWLAARRRHVRQLGAPVSVAQHPAAPGAGLLALAGGLVVVFGLGGLAVILGLHLGP